MIMTDAVSFNLLCRGQLEFLKFSLDCELTIICGGDVLELERLKNRHIGCVVDMGFVRPPSLWKDCGALTRLFFFLLRHRFDLVVYSTPKALFLGSLAAFFSGQSRRMAMVRGRVYENKKGRSRFFFRMLDWISLKISSEVIFISKSLLAGYIADNLVDLGKGKVVGAGSSNGVDCNKFSSAKRDDASKARTRAKHGLSPEDFVVISVGRVSRDKGILELRDVIEITESPNAKFLLVGPIDDEYGRGVVDDLRRTRSNFIYLDRVDDVSEFFAIAELHLFLSHREGFGNVAIEAAASSVPTLAFDVIGVADSVENGISGLRLPFGDVVAVAREIDSIVQSNARSVIELSEMDQWVKRNFSQEVVWQAYGQVYLS